MILNLGFVTRRFPKTIEINNFTARPIGPSIAPAMPGLPSIYFNISETVGSSTYTAACK